VQTAAAPHWRVVAAAHRSPDNPAAVPLLLQEYAEQLRAQQQQKELQERPWLARRMQEEEQQHEQQQQQQP
jgi:hypothetical protein